MYISYTDLSSMRVMAREMPQEQHNIEISQQEPLLQMFKASILFYFSSLFLRREPTLPQSCGHATASYSLLLQAGNARIPLWMDYSAHHASLICIYSAPPTCKPFPLPPLLSPLSPSTPCVAMQPEVISHRPTEMKHCSSLHIIVTFCVYFPSVT